MLLCAFSKVRLSCGRNSLVEDGMERSDMELVVNNLTYAYAQQATGVFETASWLLSKPGIYTIEGKNGSGKSTLFKILAGIADVPTEAEIRLNDGSPRDRVLGERAYKSVVGYVPDTPILFDELTGEEHVTLFEELWEMSREERDGYERRVNALAQKMGLNRFMEQKVRTFSYGTKYKLFFVLMLSRELRLLMLDEPFTSLDKKSQEIAMELVRTVGETAIVIISSHQKEVLERFSTDRYVIEDRKIKGVQGNEEILVDMLGG